MSFTPKRSENDYIQLKKKITNKQIIKLVVALSEEWLLTEQEAAYRFFTEKAMQEIQKRDRATSFRS